MIEQLQAALANENAQRYLRMLQQAEGTYKGADGDPYRVAFGGGTIADLSRHPKQMHDFTQTDGVKNKTSVAGAYQFLGSTWDDVSGKLGLQDFSPRSQDLAALELMRRNGSLQDVLAGNFDQAVKKDGKTWASLPSSPYAQPRRSQGFIEKALGGAMPVANAQQTDPWAGLMQEFSGNGAPSKQEDDPWTELMEQFKTPEAPKQAKPVQAPQGAPTPANTETPSESPASTGMQKASLNLRSVQVEAPQGDAFAGIRRQLGLTGRYALEGLGQAADIVAAPINALTGGTNPSKSASQLSDWLGLPKPEGKLESVVGDATRLGFGAAAPAGLAAKLAPMATSTAGKALATGLAQNPAAQIGGGAGSGAAMGATRETGGGDVAQMVAVLAGGVAGGMAGQSAMRQVGRGVESGVAALGGEALIELKPKQMTAEQLQVALQQKLSLYGQNWDKLPKQAQASLMADVRKANNLDALDVKALGRLADMRATGVTPTRGTVTLDPVQITREKNLAKAGANSGNAGLQGLAKVENDNNAVLIKRLQELQGSRDVDATEAGRMLSNAIATKRDALRQAEQAAWDAAKASDGYKMPMDAKVLSDMSQALGDSALMPFMDKNISAYMQALQANPEQFTPQAYQNLQSMLSRAMAAGGNEAAAAGMARKVLEGVQLKPQATRIPNPEMLPATEAQARVFRATDGVPGSAMDAINQARAATRAAYAFEDSSPLVRKALSDGSMGDPTRLGKHLLNSTPDEAAEIAHLLGDHHKAIARAALATHIKQKALSGAADEVGSVSQKGLNSAIRSIGDEKLSLFFAPDEVEQLKRLGRVASYLQAQPAGSAVNNSNSGAMMVGKTLDALGGLAKLPTKIPLFGIDQTANAVVNLAGTRGAMSIGKGLLDPQQITGTGILNYGTGSGSRGLISGGLLAATEDAERAKNRHGKQVTRPAGVKSSRGEPRI